MTGPQANVNEFDATMRVNEGSCTGIPLNICFFLNELTDEGLTIKGIVIFVRSVILGNDFDTINSMEQSSC
jgi:hypothetical protein